MLGRYRWAALAGAMLVSLPSSAAMGQAAQPSPAGDTLAQATARFMDGQKLYSDKKFAEALVEFQASYAAVPSPNSRLYIARCLRRLGRNGAAYEEYGQVILEAADRAATDKKYAGTLQAATDERAEIKDRVGTIKLAVPVDVPGVKVRVGVEEVPAARWGQPVPADVGSVTVRAEAPGRAPFEKTIEVKPGEQQELAVTFESATVAAGGGGSGGGGGGGSGEGGGGFNFMSNLPLRTMAIASGGVGVMGLAMWGIFGAAASSRYDDLERKCAGRCDSFYQGDVDAGRRETGASTAGLVIGIVGLAGGAAFFTIDYMNRNSGASSPSSPGNGGGASVSFGVVPSPGGSFVTVGGVF